MNHYLLNGAKSFESAFESHPGVLFPRPLKKMKTFEWVNILKENITPDDLGSETLYALLNHLVDLGLLVPCDNDFLRWQGLANGLEWEEQKQVMQNGVLKMSQTEPGFALPFFIGFEAVKFPTLESLIDAEDKKAISKNIPKPERASDLSNLQIVKKVGRQLEPFLKAESTIVSRLIGKQTTKADARHLFHYMFGKMGSKAQPRKWEQLSRKRHR